MAAVEKHRWTRARYPLQLSIKENVKPSLAAYLSKHHQSDVRTTSNLMISTPNTAESVNTFPSYQRAEDVHGDDESVTAVSRSSRSPSLASSSAVGHIQSPPVESELPIAKSPLAHFVATTSPAEEEEQHSLSDRSVSPTRKLRRTPRSRRITSRGSLGEVNEAALTERSMENEPRAARSATDSNEQSPHRIPDSAHSLSNTEEEEAAAAAAAEETKAATEPWQRHTYPINTAPPSNKLTPPTSPTLDKGTTQERNSSIASLNGSAWQRSPYPLQVPATDSALKGPPTPPVEEHTAEQKVHALVGSNTDRITTPPNTTSFRRPSYPIQSPASVANLKVVPVPTKPAQGETASPSTANASSESNRATGGTTKPLRRKAYPIQSPVSTVDLRHSISSSHSTLVGETPSTAGLTIQTSLGSRQHAQESSPTTKNRGLRRQSYPIQSPASIAELQNSNSTPSPGAKTSGLASKSHEIHAGLMAFRRRAYPLQSPASINDLQQASTITPPRSPSQNSLDHDEPPRYQMTDAATASTESDRSEIMSDEDVDEDGEAHMVLPKNIRALKDSNKPHSSGRTIVVCLDGTGDKFDDDNSNIVHIVSALKKDDADQVSYYQAGIGTYGDGGLSSGYEAAMDMAVGSGLGVHIRDAYQFLMQCYKEGDRICIFGFSRGAYTARCLAGMVHKVGLLPPRNHQQVLFAYEFYKNDTPEGWEQSNQFKRTFSIDVSVHFLGCFDSVASVGFIPRQLPLSSTPGSKARHFRHAMALDERRAKFKVCRYQARTQESTERPKSATSAAVSKVKEELPNYKSQRDTPPASQYNPDLPYGKYNHPNTTDEEYKFLNSHDDNFETDVLEVWFAGCHADIGGGAVANIERHKLAQIPLRWMIRQAFECNTGIIFKTKVLAEFGLDIHMLWPQYGSLDIPSPEGPPPSYLEKYQTCLPPRSTRAAKLIPIDRQEKGEKLFRFHSHKDEDWTPEQIEDYYDAISPMNDQLVQAPSWWILEFWPVEFKVSYKPNEVLTRTGMNLGRYRLVDDHEALIHWTAIHRARSQGHKIYSRTAPHTQWKIVV